MNEDRLDGVVAVMIFVAVLALAVVAGLVVAVAVL